MLQASFQQSQESFQQAQQAHQAQQLSDPDSSPTSQAASQQPMKNYEIRWTSSEDKKPTWKQVKVFIGAAGRYLPMQAPMSRNP